MKEYKIRLPHLSPWQYKPCGNASPSGLNQNITNTANVTSVAITNAEKCVQGVTEDQGCVIITIVSPSLIETYNITTIQELPSNRRHFDRRYQQGIFLRCHILVYVCKSKRRINNALGTSGAISGNRTISVVYTMSRPNSSYLFDRLSTILIPKQIRDDGGFFDAAQKMAQDSNSSVTFAITPGKAASLYQLQVSKVLQTRAK